MSTDEAFAIEEGWDKQNRSEFLKRMERKHAHKVRSGRY